MSIIHQEQQWRRLVLHGGPFDGVTTFAPAGAFELGLERRGRIALYAIEGEAGRYLGPRPLSWLDDDEDDDDSPNTEDRQQ